MKEISKPIRLSAHAKLRASLRGASEEEIIETIKTAKRQKAQLNKLECQKDFVFNQVWNNKFYKTKQVKSVFIEEEKEIVVVTVYVYYF